MKSKYQFISALPLSFIAFGLTLASCGGEAESTETTTDTKKDSVVTEVEKTALAPGLTPWDFPTVGMQSEAGNYVLTPSFKMYQNSLEEEDPANSTLIFYDATMSVSGEVESDIEFTFDGVQKMPNSLVINIPKGQTAKVGDIVLTWWQSGSGMQRAIVTDASNPAAPKVRYLDISFDNPAKDDKSGKSIGATEYELKPDSFVKISSDWQEGNVIAVKGDFGYESAQIIKVSGDKVLTVGFAGKVKVYSKADCKNVPMIPNVKAGDKVWAVTSVSFTESEVVKVDKKLGVVFVKANNNEYPVSFGEITTEELK